MSTDDDKDDLKDDVEQIGEAVDSIRESVLDEMELTPEEKFQIMKQRAAEAAAAADAKATEEILQRPPGTTLNDDYLARVQGRVDEKLRITEEGRRTQAFQEFFTLTAQVNEAGQDLAIKKAVLDVEAGEVTVTYRTRPVVTASPEPELDDSIPQAEATAA